MRASCPICADVFDEINSIIACPCGHVFHEICLLKWINQSCTCPECREKVTARTTVKLFFNVIPSEAPNLHFLENEVDTLKASLKLKDADIMRIKKEKEDLQAYARSAEERADRFHQEVLKCKGEITTLSLTVKNLNKLRNKVEELEKNNSSLYEKLQHFQNVQTVISGTQKDLEDVLETVPNGPEALKQMATYCSLLKRELSNIADSKQKLQKEMTCVKKDICLLNINNNKYKDEIKLLKEQLLTLEKENLALLKNRQKVLLNVASNNSESDAAVVFESPTPERLKKPFTCSNAFSVTPVRDRIMTPLARVRMESVPFESTSHACKINFTKTLSNPLLKVERNSSNDENSIIRNGYNGLGGHSKFITGSSFKKFKVPPHKKK